jgi:toluene monooxygenase system protein E
MTKAIYRTWPLLQERLKTVRPKEYDIVTYKLHYHFTGHDAAPRFELDPNAPVVQWYRRYREGSPFRVEDWDEFRDPDEITYWRYNIMHDDAEEYIDHLLRQAEIDNYDRKLEQRWLLVLRDYYGPMRYPYHGLQMMAMYLMQLAPASSISNCHAFCGMDNLRVLQRIAYRVKMLDIAYPTLGFGKEDQRTWEDNGVFQPLREAIERGLCAYDWGEGFAVLNLVLKPLVDELFLTHFAELALINGDHLLMDMQRNFYLDALRHRRWVTALVQFAVGRNAANQPLLEGHVAKWFPLAWRGVEAFQPVFEHKNINKIKFQNVLTSLRRTYTEFLQAAGLKAP